MSQARRAPYPDAGPYYDIDTFIMPLALSEDNSPALAAKAAAMIPILEAEALETSKKLYAIDMAPPVMRCSMQPELVAAMFVKLEELELNLLPSCRAVAQRLLVRPSTRFQQFARTRAVWNDEEDVQEAWEEVVEKQTKTVGWCAWMATYARGLLFSAGDTRCARVEEVRESIGSGDMRDARDLPPTYTQALRGIRISDISSGI